MQAGRTLYGRVVRTPAGFFEAVDAARAAPARHEGLLDTMELCEALGRLEGFLGAKRGSCSPSGACVAPCFRPLGWWCITSDLLALLMHYSCRRS